MLAIHLGCREFQFFMLQSTLTSPDKCCYKSKRYRSSDELVEDVLFEIVWIYFYMYFMKAYIWFDSGYQNYVETNAADVLI